MHTRGRSRMRRVNVDSLQSLLLAMTVHRLSASSLRLLDLAHSPTVSRPVKFWTFHTLGARMRSNSSSRIQRALNSSLRSAMPLASHPEEQASPRRWRTRMTAHASMQHPPSNLTSCSTFPPLSIRLYNADLYGYGGTRQRCRGASLYTLLNFLYI